MRARIGSLSLVTALWLSLASGAANASGAETAQGVCAACHGANGISVSADIPNLAGQRAKYLESQLKAFRAGERSNAIMNAVAEQTNRVSM